jgi:hypothetical protein
VETWLEQFRVKEHEQVVPARPAGGHLGNGNVFFKLADRGVDVALRAGPGQRGARFQFILQVRDLDRPPFAPRGRRVARRHTPWSSGTGQGVAVPWSKMAPRSEHDVPFVSAAPTSAQNHGL